MPRVPDRVAVDMRRRNPAIRFRVCCFALIDQVHLGFMNNWSVSSGCLGYVSMITTIYNIFFLGFMFNRGV